MLEREIALEALGFLCNATVTSVQQQNLTGQLNPDDVGGAQLLTIVDEKRVHVSLENLSEDEKTGKLRIHLTVDEEKLFEPRFDYDFSHLKDTETPYMRGGEEYKRPCGWYRFGLKVEGKYGDDTWLGTGNSRTGSCPGEWPVSYHGTSAAGADGIIKEYYKAGDQQVYGRGVYSTPDVSVAEGFLKTFTSKNGKTYKVILQNRINPQYRKKHCNDLFWLIPIPKGTPEAEEKMMVERAVRPYGLLLQEVNYSPNKPVKKKCNII